VLSVASSEIRNQIAADWKWSELKTRGISLMPDRLPTLLEVAMRSRVHIKSHPLHPMLIAFPIGLWVASLVLDLIGRGASESVYWSAGFFCAIGGILGALAAAVPGTIDYLTIVPPRSSAKKRGLTHGLLNVAVLVLFCIEAVHRGSYYTRPDGLCLVLSFAGVLLLAISGWLGATLVYRNQIAVDHRYANSGTWKERSVESFDRPICNQGELAQGQMMLAHIGKERVVVAHCEQGMVAFEDHCSHKGGPLSDGAVIGCAVQCPWHGSQFDLRTGRVIAGPAQEKIKIYAIDVRGGEVFVKPA